MPIPQDRRGNLALAGTASDGPAVREAERQSLAGLELDLDSRAHDALLAAANDHRLVILP